jgi:hypothetical protein
MWNATARVVVVVCVQKNQTILHPGVDSPNLNIVFKDCFDTCAKKLRKE